MSDFPSRPVRKTAYTARPTTIIEKYLGTSESKFFFFAYWIFLPCIERLKLTCVYNALIYRSERFNASFLKQLILRRCHEVPSLGLRLFRFVQMQSDEETLKVASDLHGSVRLYAAAMHHTHASRTEKAVWLWSRWASLRCGAPCPACISLPLQDPSVFLSFSQLGHVPACFLLLAFPEEPVPLTSSCLL